MKNIVLVNQKSDFNKIITYIKNNKNKDVDYVLQFNDSKEGWVDKEIINKNDRQFNSILDKWKDQIKHVYNSSKYRIVERQRSPDLEVNYA